MRSPSHQDNNFLLPSKGNNNNSNSTNTSNDDSSSTTASPNESNDPDDSRFPPTIKYYNTNTIISNNNNNNNVKTKLTQKNLNLNNLNSNLPNFVKPSTSTTQTNAIFVNDSSYSSSNSSSDMDFYSVNSLSTSTATSPGNNLFNKTKLSSILSTSLNSSSSSSSSSSSNSSLSSDSDSSFKASPVLKQKQNSKKNIFIKKYPNDPTSKDGIDIDKTIKKLIYLNTTTATTSSKSKKRGSFPFHSWEIQLICSVAREIFLNQPTLLRLQAPIKIVGDLHGQFNDFLRILKLSGIPSETNYLFLGDYVDRGKQSLETILLLLCYKIKYPNNFFMLRGNHESANVTKMYGFYDECKRRKSTKIWKSFIDVFNCLPIAATINDKIFCVHGGISPDLKNLKQIDNDIVRPTDIPDDGLLTDLLWSDPDSSVKDWSLNDRGVSYTFSKNNVLDFCSKFKFDLIIRGHMVVEDGYEFFAKKKLVTVFSAPNYCGQFQNWGAVLAINTGLMCSFELLKPHQINKKRV